MAEAMRKRFSEQAAGFVIHFFSLYGHVEIEELATWVGFRDICVKTYNKELHLPKAEEFLWQYVFSTPLTDLVSQADGDPYLRKVRFYFYAIQQSEEP